MAVPHPTNVRNSQVAENEELRARLEEAEETLRAIRSGEVDALVVATPAGDSLFTLQGADHSYRALIEKMNEGALSLTSDGMILFANERFAAMLQAPLSQVIGSYLEAWIVPESRKALRSLIENARLQQCREEMNLAAANGVTIPIYLSLNPVPLNGLHDTLGVVATDLTEQKRAERAIRLSEAKFRNVFESSLLGQRLVSANQELKDLKVNKTFCEITGYPEEELQQIGWQRITHSDDLQATTDAFQQLLDGTATTVRLENRYMHKNGGVVWADATYTVVLDEAGKALYFLVAINDITARKQADAAVHDLKQHLQRNIEMERLRLAQNLHDVPLQQLYVVIYKLEELRANADAEAGAVLGHVIEDIQETLGSLRAVASELRPPALSRFGLEKAIRSLMQEFMEKYPAVRVQLSLAHDNQALPEEVRLLLYRVLQEALANAIRHAQASEVRVEFNFDAEESRIEVSDNGKGFEVPASWLSLVRDGHYGLAGMAERVNAAGGTLDVLSAPGSSTTVRVILPYSRP